MTVDDAIVLLKQISNKGEGGLPLQIMLVEQGITIANDIEIARAEMYDGDRVWVYGVERHLPEWMSNALMSCGPLKYEKTLRHRRQLDLIVSPEAT